MGRVPSKSSQLAFNAGEWSPFLDARVDLEKYRNACRTLKNTIVKTHGLADRRPGTQYRATAKHAARKCRMEDFQFSPITTFLLEFGHEYIRFFSNGVQVTSGGSPYEIASPYQEADLFEVQFTQSNDVAYLTHPDYPVYKLSRIADDNWTLAEVEWDVPPFLDENVTGTTLAASATTGTGVTLEASSAIFQAGHVGSYWQLGHHREAAFISRNITTNGTSDSITILGDWNVRTYGIWSADILIQRSFDNGFTWSTVRKVSGREDRNADIAGTQEDEALYRVKIENRLVPSSAGATTPRVVIEAVDAFVYGLVKVTAFVDTDTVTVTVIDTLHSTAATDVWREGAWSDVRGYPRAAAIFEQSVWYAGTSHQPQTIWKTRTGDFENFQYGSSATDALAYTLGSKRGHTILWLVGMKVLMVGTNAGEFALSSGDNDDPITPSNIVVKAQSEHGSRAAGAKLVNDAILFVQRGGKKVRELTYSFERDKYVAPDLTLLAEHITAGGIEQMAVQAIPIPILWAVKGDGDLIGLTYEREQDVIAWHPHETDGEFESVATIAGTGSDEVWFSVKRTINGSAVRYIERFNPTEWEDKDDCYYVDSGKSFDFGASPASTLTGMSHLEGESLAILADGKVQPAAEVASGSVTLEAEYTKVHAGLAFDSIIKPMRLDADAIVGVTQGLTKRIREVFVRFYKSLGCTVADGAGYEDTIDFRQNTDPFDSSPPLLTGDKQVDFDGGHDEAGNIIISQTEPLPMTVLALVIKYDVERI